MGRRERRKGGEHDLIGDELGTRDRLLCTIVICMSMCTPQTHFYHSNQSVLNATGADTVLI
jgi:hypothetical protein